MCWESVQSTEKITPSALTKHYKSILEGSEIQMFYCGSATPERVEAAVLEAFKILPRREIADEAATQVRISCGEPNYHVEMWMLPRESYPDSGLVRLCVLPNLRR